MSVLVPATRHYSWDKALDVLGLGPESLVRVPVDAALRMDAGALERILDEHAQSGRHVLACVAIIGSTETGSVDPLDLVMAARAAYERRSGRTFFVHVDAAYGGYARTLLRPSTEEAPESTKGHGLRPELAAALDAMREADSVTMDPHKLGFVPYPAGALLLRDRSFCEATRFGARYLGEGAHDHPGAFTLEGSRPGAAASACWLAHRTVPLDRDNHGSILRASFSAARALSRHLDGAVFGDAACHVLATPDLDIVVWAFSPRAGATLEQVNALQRRVLAQLGPVGRGPFALASTTLQPEVHGDAVLPTLERLGVDPSEWRPGASLVVLRSVMMTPFVSDPEVGVFYRERLVEALRAVLSP